MKQSAETNCPTQWGGIRDVERVLECGSSRAYRLAGLGAIRSKVLIGGRRVYNLGDALRIKAETTELAKG
jgi:hypothetical protein